MAERSVRVRLTAVIDDFRKQMRGAADATGQVGAAAQDAEKKSSRLGDAAKSVGKVALTGLAVATTATVGLGTAAFKAGLNYNSLEQQSRMALTTMLGSTEAATAQMEKLVEFGRTSPFSRAVWIEAQGQLIGFGMAAERVIPTLSAIQDAAAATGRTSAADIGEIVNVFAKIQSTGKITARELNQLGMRGIDAAALLGQAYGKTADQIRDDITSGALDGRQALIDLTDQMSIRFAGAAEGLRNTWFGAVDRIKGAFRDIGSIIAAPFVDPAGGGAAVDWANSLADAMRALEAVLGPVVTALASRAGPAFQSITDTLERAAEAMRNADPDRVTEQLGRLTPAVAGLGAAGLTASSRMIPFVRGFGPQGALVAGLAGFVLSVPEARRALLDLLDALAPVAQAAADLAAALVPIVADAIARVVEKAEPAIKVIEGFGAAIEFAADKAAQIEATAEGEGFWARYAGNVEMATGALWDIVNTVFPVGAGLELIGSGFGVVEKESGSANWSVEQYNRSTNEAGLESNRAAPQVDEFGVALDHAAIAAEEADEQLQSYLETVKRATDPVYALHGALNDVEKAQDDYNEAVKEYGPKSKEAQDAAFNLMRQLDNLEAAALSGELSFEEFEARLDEWVRQGKITSGQADATKARIKELRGEAEDYKGEYNATIKQTGADATMKKIRDVKSLVESFKNKGITLTVNAQTGSFRIIGRGFAGSLAEGGPVFGGGTGTSDSVPAWLSRGEHVWTAKEVSNAGGHEAVAAIRDHFRFAKGGGLGELNIRSKARDPNAFATDFSDSFARTLGRDAARAGKTLASVTPGRVLPRGSYRIGMPYLGYPGHYGADYPAPPMTPVYAMAAGVVERAMRMATSYGNHIFLRHANGIQTRYAHMLGLRATAGQFVGPGQHIGWVGSSGNSTGPHLHFEYRRNGAPINPATLGIFDGGGVMKPGQGGFNMSSKPEAVLTDSQWSMLKQAVTAPSAPAVEPGVLAREVARAIDGATIIIDDRGQGRLLARNADLYGRAG